MTAQRASVVETFFPHGARFSFLPIRKLADANNSELPGLAQPSFQRDAVWDEAHVELLWDSMLRGFPVGAILLTETFEGAVKRLQRTASDAARHTEPAGPGLLLIDGQQRAIAAAAGFRSWRPGDRSRLWIDLAAPTSPRDGVRFRVVLCTIRHPWGRGASEAQKRDAAARLDGGKRTRTRDATLGETWPVAAIAPVPLAEYLARVLRGRGEQWSDLLPPCMQTGAVEPPFRATVADALHKIGEYSVPAILLETPESVESLGTAFQRLNKQGVEMSGEELFFSGLKIRWPEAHDLVWDIYRDDTVGRFLSPPKIVHAATRLTTRLRFEAPREVIRLDVETFRKLVEFAEPGTDGATGFLQGMRHYLDRPATGDPVGRLHRYLGLARRALAYRPEDPADPGLPAPLLARVRWGVWHALAAWIAAGDRFEVAEADRAEMIRFVMMSLLCVGRDSDSLNRVMLEVAAGAPSAFPGRAIHDRLREQAIVDRNLLRPGEYEGRTIDAAGTPQWPPLHNEELVVMWSQRAFIARCFPNYDPTLYKRTDDLPYDIDHIVPQACMDMRGRREHLPLELWNWRGPLLQGAGNQRYWPKSVNRGDGDRTPFEKHLTSPADVPLPADSPLREAPYLLATCGEVQRASGIPADDAGLWLRAGETRDRRFDWRDPERTLAFAWATTRRRVALYEGLFVGVGFAEWIDGGPQVEGISSGV